MTQDKHAICHTRQPNLILYVLEGGWGASVWPPPFYIVNHCYLKQAETWEENAQLYARKHSVLGLGQGSDDIEFHWWAPAASQQPPRKACYSCPLGEPAWKGSRSYLVIRTCQHLGYAGWFNPIMWMEPVIGLMKGTPVSKRALNDFLFIFCLHVMRYWCHYLIIQQLVS